MLFPSTSLVLCVGLLVSGIQAAPLKKVESFDLETRAPIEPLLEQRDLLSSTVYEHERRDLDEFDLELRDFEDDLLERRDFEPELELRDLEFDDLERRDDETVSFERRDDSHLSELEKRAGGNAAVASKAWSVGKSLFNRVRNSQTAREIGRNAVHSIGATVTQRVSDKVSGQGGYNQYQQGGYQQGGYQQGGYQQGGYQGQNW